MNRNNQFKDRNIMFRDNSNSKYQQLIKYLAQNKKKSEQLMIRMEKTLQNSQKAKQSLNVMGSRMNSWQQGYKKVIREMALKMVMPVQNPLKLNPEGGPCQMPSFKTIEFVVQRLQQQEQILFLTGAGVSCASGIPTFRGDNGLYRKKFIVDQKQYDPQQFVSYSFFKRSPEVIWQWNKRFNSIVKKNKPNVSHHLIDEICTTLVKKFNKKVTLITTNIDGYHIIPRQPYRNEKQAYRVHQIHGNVHYQLCQQCGLKQQIPQQLRSCLDFELENMNRFQTLAINNSVKLKCSKCNSKQVRPNILFFDEKYQTNFGGQIVSKEQNYPFVISIGSSLETGLCAKIVLQAGETVEVNKKGVIEFGKVYKFQQSCQIFLKELSNKLCLGNS